MLWQASHRAERAKFRVVCKALIAESSKIFRVGDTVVNDESRHGSPTGLSPYGLDLQIGAFSIVHPVFFHLVRSVPATHDAHIVRCHHRFGCGKSNGELRILSKVVRCLV